MEARGIEPHRGPDGVRPGARDGAKDGRADKAQLGHTRAG